MLSAKHKAQRASPLDERLNWGRRIRLSSVIPRKTDWPFLREDRVKKIVLISCVSKKLPNRAPARDLYVSPLFRLNLKYAQILRPDAIFIVSALYGLLDLDTVVEPYNLTLNTMSSHDVQDWAKRVLKQLRERADLEHDHFVFLAGHKYRTFLVPGLHSFDIPMEGLTIGRQLHYLTEKVHERRL